MHRLPLKEVAWSSGHIKTVVSRFESLDSAASIEAVFRADTLQLIQVIHFVLTHINYLFRYR